MINGLGMADSMQHARIYLKDGQVEVEPVLCAMLILM